LRKYRRDEFDIVFDCVIGLFRIVRFEIPPTELGLVTGLELAMESEKTTSKSSAAV